MTSADNSSSPAVCLRHSAPAGEEPTVWVELTQTDLNLIQSALAGYRAEAQRMGLHVRAKHASGLSRRLFEAARE